MTRTRALARRPAGALVADAAGATLPSYVTREQARAIINAAESLSVRGLLREVMASRCLSLEWGRAGKCHASPIRQRCGSKRRRMTSRQSSNYNGNRWGVTCLVACIDGRSAFY